MSERYVSTNNCVECVSNRTTRRKPEHIRRNNLKRAYGITPEDVEAMRVAQGNKCAICPTSFDTSPSAVDHCHATSVVRGLLCNHCNLMLGHARDNVETLTRAIAYLTGT